MFAIDISDYLAHVLLPHIKLVWIGDLDKGS